MSKFLKMMMLAALFFVPWVSQAQTHYTMQIGSGTATSQYLPDYAYYNYCYTQMLYTSSDVGIDGMIDTLAFQVSSNSTTRNVTIYMAEVAQTTLSSQVSASQFTQVFSGSVTWNQGWPVIALDSVMSICTPDSQDGSAHPLRAAPPATATQCRRNPAVCRRT